MIDLSRNESPFPPSGRAVSAALRQAQTVLNRYPSELHHELLRLVKRRYAGRSEDAIITRGVDDAVDLFISNFPAKLPVYLRPEFPGFRERCAALHRRYRIYPLDNGFGFPEAKLRNLDGGNLFLVSCPHNPTGVEFPREMLLRLAAQGCYLFIDRAYREFAADPTANDHRGPTVFRFYSFSKAFSLAAQRIGVLVGPRTHIGNMRSRQQFLSTDAATLLLLKAALKADWGVSNARRVIELRTGLIRMLKSAGILVQPTETNFILLYHDNSALIHKELHKRGIVVTTTELLGLPRHLRISVGTRTENAQLVATLKAVLTL